MQDEKIQDQKMGNGKAGNVWPGSKRTGNKRILLAAYEMTYTGSPRALLNLALALQELGYQPCVWAFHGGPFAREFTVRGISLEVVPFPGAASKALAERISGYFLVIAFTVFCASFASYAGKYTETVLYLMEASNLPELVRGCGLDRADIVNAGHLLCVSGYAREFIRREYGCRHVDILRNYVEPWEGAGYPRWRTKERETQGRPGKTEEMCQGPDRGARLKFLVSGTLEYRKGQDVAEEAYLCLPEELREASELHFIGQTPEWSRDFQEALRRKAEGNIFFHEEIFDRDELYRFYDSCDVILVTSRDESCSLVALEAAMLGKPLLVTDRTGAMYITDRACVLPAADAGALCAKMREFLLHRERLEGLGERNRGMYLRLGTREGYLRALRRYLAGLGRAGRMRKLAGFGRAGRMRELADAGRMRRTGSGAGRPEGYRGGRELAGPGRATRAGCGGNTMERRERAVKMGEGVKVSIVVPVYNVEKYLRECMDSVLGQTLREIEVICVDDGSTDGSPEILKSYGEKDPRVKIISKKNSGYGNTMNIGMDAASGEYIGIVESDDYAAPEMFAELYQAAQTYGAQAVKSDHYTFRTKAGREQKTFCGVCPAQYYGRILNARICPEIFTFAMMNWTGIYRRDFLVENRIRHNETPGASFQDNGFWFQVMSLAERMVFLNKAFYYYRQDNPGSSINNKEKVFCICDEFRYIRAFLEAHPELGGRYFKSYFEKKFFNYFHSYHRIAEEYRLPFLRRAAEEFKEELGDKRLKAEEMDSWVYVQVNRIIDSPELFYFEDRKASMEEAYDRIHGKLMQIRNSEEFRRGLKVKKLLHKK